MASWPSWPCSSSAVVALGVLPGPLLQTTIADVTAITDPRERDPVSSSVVSVDAGVLLPVLAPAAGAAAVLVLDVVATRLRRSHYLLALVSVVVGVFGTLPGSGCRAR